MFNVMSMHRDFPDLEQGQGPQPFDAVVHFAAVPRILIKPDNETFRINTMGTYNVIEAAVKSRHPQDHRRVQRDHLWRLLCRRSPRFPSVSAG
jgi:nucleoside-diphosphate-sugar epimerase